MKVLLFGSSGQLGSALESALRSLGDVIAPPSSSLLDGGIDLNDLHGLAAAVRAIRPHLIVNAAAHTDLDDAEANPTLAWRVNAQAPAVMAREAQAIGACLLQYSTDCVFDGRSSLPYDEEAETAPLSAYGCSKLSAEQAVRGAGARWMILRTSWLHGPLSRGFVHKVLAQARRGPIEVVDDQRGTPTGAAWLAEASVQALRLWLRDPALGGLYHAVAEGTVSRHDQAVFIVEWAHERGLVAGPARDIVRAISTEARPGRAPRPLNACLDNAKLKRCFGLRPPHWTDSLVETLTQIDQPS